MLVDYAVTETGCFDDYLDARSRAKTMRRNGINIFLLQVAQCITFNQTKFGTKTLLEEARLKSLYSRLGFLLKTLRHFLISKVLAIDIIMSKENPKHYRNKKLA